MDFRFTAQKERFREEVRSFLDTALTQEVEDEYESFQYAGLGPHSKQFHLKVAERGWVGMGWPKEYGGTEEGYVRRQRRQRAPHVPVHAESKSAGAGTRAARGAPRRDRDRIGSVRL